MKPALAVLAIGVLASAGWVVMTVASAGTMPSYLAAWLFWLAVPMGALAIVVATELAGPGGQDGPVMLVLRRALLLLPVGALFALPVLFSTAPLFRRPSVANPLPADWMAPGAFIVRACVILVVLSVLAVLFSRPTAAPRRLLSAIGLMAHLSLVSIAAVDWVMSLQPGLNSSAIGVLLIASQLGVAACLAAFVIAVATPPGAPVPRAAGSLLAVVLAIWAALHFMQFLVVWSANLPAEITWYLDRLPGLGGPFIWSAVAATVIGIALLPTAAARVPAVLASLAAMLLLAHLAETLWLVTPAFRGSFTITLADALALLGIGGLVVGLLLMLLPRRPEDRYAA